MVFLTADLHFGDAKVLRYRNFNSIANHDDYLISQINLMAGTKDILFILGDLGDPRQLLNINCKQVHLITGNNDSCNTPHVLSQQDYCWITEDIYASHYPHLLWPNSQKGSYHVFGHAHGSCNNNPPNSMDVGVDSIYNYFGDYWPISLSTLRSRFFNDFESVNQSSDSQTRCSAKKSSPKIYQSY